MIRFECDYAEGMHPRILEALFATNAMQTAGYGEDEYCESARRLIRNACQNEDMDVHFLTGGTQANATIIACALRPYQAVISAATGHIAGHETGAIEATGHKVITLPAPQGKISAAQVKTVLDEHYSDPTREHVPQPAMVYISQPTEAGTIYSKSELENLRQVCTDTGVYLFIDGARLGYALAADGCDVSLSDLSNLCDVFYIGGTKVGAMFGEAVCITNGALKKDFRYNMKQRGAMLSKGRFLGLQFETLFTDGLYFRISRNAVAHAMQIKNAFISAGVKFLYDSPTNQQFPIVPVAVYEVLSQKFSFALWEKLDSSRVAIRVVTSWAANDEETDLLVSEIKRIYGV